MNISRRDRRVILIGGVIVLLVAAVKVALTPIVGLGTFILHGRKLHADPLWADGAAQMAAAGSVTSEQTAQND